jgi:hypothetical protein
MDHHHIKRTTLKHIRNEVHKIKEEYSHKGNELLLYNKLKEKEVQTRAAVLLYVLK